MDTFPSLWEGLGVGLPRTYEGRGQGWGREEGMEEGIEVRYKRARKRGKEKKVMKNDNNIFKSLEVIKDICNFDAAFSTSI